jgi:4-hydroxybenzoate polyprenyltransferase
MTTRLRLLLLLARPAVVVLVSLFATIGLAQAGRPDDVVLLVKALSAVLAFLLFAVAVNDLADEAIDRVNLRDARGRPLVAQRATHREMVVVAAGAAVVTFAVSCTLHFPAIVVATAGLLLAAGYSLRPVRLADRGAVASLALPAGYVAVPYLLGVFAVRGYVTANDVLVLLGLYAGFIGRIVLKDFRDVRGDALFGKRTFLIRHGRAATCRVAAVSWVAGASVLLAVRQRTPALVVTYALSVVLTLALLRALAGSTNPHRDEALIGAVAIVGRGLMVTLLAHLAAVGAGWPATTASALVLAVLVLFAGSAWSMAAPAGEPCVVRESGQELSALTATLPACGRPPVACSASCRCSKPAVTGRVPSSPNVSA